MDVQQYYQPAALFAYIPVSPKMGDTLTFQNLSTNATTFLWNFDDPTSGVSNTSSEEFPTHIFASNGVYNVQLTASNGTFTATYDVIIVIGNLSITQNNSEFESSIFPNPFSNHFTLNNKLTEASYLLTSMNGQVIYSGKNIEEQDFSSLKSGIYIVTSWNSKEIRKYKIIKE